MLFSLLLSSRHLQAATLLLISCRVAISSAHNVKKKKERVCCGGTGYEMHQCAASFLSVKKRKRAISLLLMEFQSSCGFAALESSVSRHTPTVVLVGYDRGTDRSNYSLFLFPVFSVFRARHFALVDRFHRSLASSVAERKKSDYEGSNTAGNYLFLFSFKHSFHFRDASRSLCSS